MVRPYKPYVDTAKVSQFLARTYPPTDRTPNWLRARWEYMVYSVQDGVEERLAPFGIWEAGGEIVALVNSEDALGEVFFQVHPEYTTLKAEMLRYAEDVLCATAGGVKRLTLYVSELDREMEALAATAGFRQMEAETQVTARLDLATASLAYTLPQGFKLTDRLENNDLRAINRVLWRGFNHQGPPPEVYVAGRADVEKAPLYRGDLVVMAEAPDGHLVSYCGVWYEAATQVALVEPVATDPDYRRQGLGKAVVLEAVRRARDLGATRAIVGSGMAFYRALGFQILSAAYQWHREW